MTSEGRMHADMVLGGRYLDATYTGDMMGMDFEGRSWTGYDKQAGEYFSTWMDNMGTGVMVFRGNVEDDALVMRAPHTDPVTGERQMHRTVQRMDDGKVVFEYFMAPEGGEEFRTMEIVYTRAE
jgi:hypothetical protein